jgi:hypothetical protein
VRDLPDDVQTQLKAVVRNIRKLDAATGLDRSLANFASDVTVARDGRGWPGMGWIGAHT